MPQTLAIGVFVLGAVMLLLALASGGFKIFGSEMPGVASRSARVIAFVIGAGLVGFSLFHFGGEKSGAPAALASAGPAQSTQTGGHGPPAAAAAAAVGLAPAAATETLADPAAARVFDNEATDYGVPPSNTPRPDVGAATPLTIPGARTLTTGELAAAMRSGRRLLLIDVLDYPHPGLPGARRYPGAGLAQPSVDIAALLAKDTGGDKAFPIVFYCQGSRCWESYNAALRAEDAGYTNIYWYRGGLEAWAAAAAAG